MKMSCTERFALHAANPLLKPFGAYVERRQDWIGILAHDPLEGVDPNNLSGEQRMMLLEDLPAKFLPTRRALNVVADVQDMVRSSLRARNPLIVEARIAQNQMLAAMSSKERLDSVPWFNTSIQGKLIWGVTGLGKTHPALRFIDLFPPVYIHEKGSIPGWMKTTQILVLYIKMTHDGFRGGFLQSILIAVDELCGTSYSDDYKKVKVETLAVRVGQILISHCVGLLVIDDIQVKNFTLSPDRDALLLLFLKILDFGIPVVLIGNPLAFVGIQSFSQDNRRLTTSEPIEYMPHDSLADKDWGDGLIPSIWRHDLMEIPTPLNESIKGLLHFHSAGFPHYLMVIRVGVQKYAIRRGIKQVTEELLLEYLGQSRTLLSSQNLLKGFRDKDPYLLSAIEDVPWQEYGVRWGKICPEEILAAKEPPSTNTRRSKRSAPTREARMQSVQRRAATQFAMEIRKRKQCDERNLNASKIFPAEDIRNEGLPNIHIAGIQALRRQAEASKTD